MGLFYNGNKFQYAVPQQSLPFGEVRRGFYYDALNRPVTITQPDSSIITNVYAKGGLLQQVLHGTTQHITDITYNARGQREDIYYGNNTKTKYYYNSLNFRITRILTTRNSGADVLQDLNYTYDAVGNITQVTDNAQQTFYFNNTVVSPTGTYTYDALYRLLTATGREQTALAMPTDTDFVNNIPCPDTATNAMQNYTHNYQYDALGNMLQMQSVGNWTRNYVYNNPMTNNYLIGHGGGTVYTYDTHGNMLTMPHLTSMVWDYLDQLHSAANGTFTSNYNYDAEGKRSRKVVIKNNIREERYYIGDYEIYRKYINNVIDTERTTHNINDDEKRFAIIDTLTVSDGQTITPVVTIRYQYDNHLGSACLELNENASIISYEEYHPFGATSYRSGRSQTEVSLKRYKYCGKERDEETGLYYYGMRYYAAWICRFVSVDPLQFKYPELTPFQYSSNNPVSMIDLDGKEGVRISKELKRNYPELYEAALTVIKSPQGKELLKDFATKKQARQYWGINEKGKYSKNVNITFSSEGDTEGGQVITKINKQDVRDIQKTLEEKQYNNENLIPIKILKKPIDKNVKMDISILSGTSGLVTDTLPGLVENYAHELFIHASYDLDYLKNILSGEISNPEDEIIQALSGDNFGDDSIQPGKLTTLFQHYLHYEKKNDLYENFTKYYLDKLVGQNKIDYIKEVNTGIKSSSEEADEYKRRIKEK